ncbi:transglutaminase family protein [Phenylobacterium sp.]|uniref:transglutaminase family protein n=1 Tax=Phenylobacterium sp. TaxID=1871053 RepID=UPI0025DB0EB2|nr:transglutaminase family protein [Phenylobacterium sp.]MCA6287179.1 transglutaminase family protein [Phenylobacterium sp.]MCA6288161.1 transglutaminase family protein [Phenylobacterium sp.]MCA6309669.1 transglutaminase family protein [Phenylobacterium sp.]MCA6323602.1 transglutaminase family protein [Phenylobacterium sp.]MCA6336221.1 transglutaminase family protein [Phenylobacterium sp.]
MLLEVRHVTRYHYAAPVRESVMEVWMQPQKTPRQRLASFDLELDPASQVFSYADPYGNAVYHFDVPQPHDQLTITARSVVETSPPEPLPEALDIGEWDRLRSDRVHGENFDFLRRQGFCVETDALRGFVSEHALDRLKDRDPLTAIRRLSETIYDAFDYEPGVTDAESPIDLALSARRGVCQDFAHIMITICRSWGIPARYVSGYLFTDREGGDRSDPDASHAWLEVFLPSTRWIGFDPTNNTLAGERHVSAAIGRDYADVPPSRGVYKGEAESQLAVGVNVRRARPTAGEPEFMRLASPSFARGGGRRRPGAGASLLERQQQQQQQ